MSCLRHPSNPAVWRWGGNGFMMLTACSGQRKHEYRHYCTSRAVCITRQDHISLLQEPKKYLPSCEWRSRHSYLACTAFFSSHYPLFPLASPFCHTWDQCGLRYACTSLLAGGSVVRFFFFFAYVMLTFRVSLTKIYYRTGVWPVLRYERYSLKPWSCNVQFLARLSHLLVLFVSISIAISTKFNSGVKVNSDNREV